MQPNETQSEFAGPATLAVLQLPSTASSGRNATCDSVGFSYGLRLGPFSGGDSAVIDPISLPRRHRSRTRHSNKKTMKRRSRP
jgi:hypothetical protein